MSQITWPVWLAIAAVLIGGVVFASKALSHQFYYSKTRVDPISQRAVIDPVTGKELKDSWPFFMAFQDAFELIGSLVIIGVPSVIVGGLGAVLTRSEAVSTNVLIGSAATFVLALVVSYVLLSDSKVIFTGAMNAAQATDEHGVNIMFRVKVRFIVILALTFTVAGFIGNMITYIALKF